MKKNLIGMLKSSFIRKMSFVLAVFVLTLASSSCKHDKGKGDNPILTSVKVNATSVAVKDEMNVGSTTNAEADLEFVTKPSDATLSFEPTSSIKSYDSVKKKGKWILKMGDNSLKIKVTKGSKTKSYTLKLKRVTEDEAILEYLKIDDESVTLKEYPETMIASNTEKEKVKIEYAGNPGSVVTTNPSIASGAEWNLEHGKNTLKFKVEKGSNIKDYTLEITRDKPAPKITSITIGPHKKDGDGIVKYNEGDPKIIEIPVPTNLSGAEYEVKVDVDMEGANVEYSPPLEAGNKIKFSGGQGLANVAKVFNIIVSKDGRESVYKVKAMMMVHAISINAARYKGRDTSARANRDIIKKIIDHEKDVSLELAGDNAFILFVSRFFMCQTILINGEDAKASQEKYPTFMAAGDKNIPLQCGQTYPIKVLISNSEYENGKPKKPWLATEEFNFTIKCKEEKADAFIDRVLVNDTNITDERLEPDAFTRLFNETELAEIDSGEEATIALELSKKVEKVTIDGREILEAQLTTGKDQNDRPIFIATAKGIPVGSNPNNLKEVIIKVSPKEEDKNSYRETTMKFNLVYKEPPKFFPNRYAINGTKDSALPPAFKYALIKGDNLLYTVDENQLAMHFEFVKKPKEVKMTIGANNLVAKDNDIITVPGSYATAPPKYVVNLMGSIDNSEKNVIIKFTPEDLGAFSSGEWKFTIKGTNEKPKLSPVFEEISDDKNLTDSFLTDLVDASNPPEYQVSQNYAILKISLTEYEKDFLLEKIMLDGVKATESEFKLVRTPIPNSTEWLSQWILEKKIIDLKSNSSKTVNIQFVGKPGIAKDVNWTLKLKSGGNLPSVPRNEIKFKIAEYGDNGIPFTDKFLEGIKNNTNPLIELYGKDVKVRFDATLNAYLKAGKFSIDGGTEIVEPKNPLGLSPYVEFTFNNVSSNVEHTIIAKVVPENPSYDDLEYKFRIKVLNQLPKPDSYLFVIDGMLRGNGYKATLDKNFATLLFQAEEPKDEGNIVEKVRIGKTWPLTDADKITLIKLDAGQAGVFWQAIKEVELSTSEFEDWYIEVTTKKPDKYADPVVCKYTLKGAEVDENNASFERQNNMPKVSFKINYKEGLQCNSPDDYGAESVDFEAYTMTKESKVKYIRVHELTGKDMPDEPDAELTREANSRILKGRVVAYNDKPTVMKLWCVGKNNSTDPINGIYRLRVNPAPLFWSYKNITSVQSGEPSYSEIKVSKARIKKNGKVYVLFAPWSEGYGWKVDLNAVSSDKQAPFIKVGRLGRYQTIYKTSLNVKDLASGENTEVMCKILHKDKDKEAFTYKVKVTIED